MTWCFIQTINVDVPAWTASSFHHISQRRFFSQGWSGKGRWNNHKQVYLASSGHTSMFLLLPAQSCSLCTHWKCSRTLDSKLISEYPLVTPAAGCHYSAVAEQHMGYSSFLAQGTSSREQTQTVFCVMTRRIVTCRACRQKTHFAGAELNSGVLVTPGGLFFLTYLHFILLISCFHLCHLKR